MKTALRYLLSDFLSAILFLVVYAIQAASLLLPPSPSLPAWRSSPASG